MFEMKIPNLMDQPQFMQACRLTEGAFIQVACDLLKEAFDADAVLIASLGLVEADYVSVAAHSLRAGDLHTKEFFASSTPCMAAIQKGEPVLITKDAAALNPKATVLVELGAEAYVGLPLIGKKDNVIGVLVLVWSKPVSASSLEAVVEAITPFHPRVGEELKRMANVHVLPALINPIGPIPVENPTQIFRDIAEQATRITGVNSVFIVHRTSTGSQQYRILAATGVSFDAGGFEGKVVNYAGGPCHNMIHNDIYLDGSGAGIKYAENPILQKMDLESYLGHGFRNSAGETIGHIAFIHNRPMRPSVKDCDVIRVIATRAGQELQRYTLERERALMDKALRVRSKLESLGTMSGTIAHDFNNQLTATIGNIELAKLVLTATHPASEYLNEAERSMWRARDVVKDIMDFAGGAREAPREQVVLGEVITNVVSEFKPRLTGESEVIVDVAPNLPTIQSRRIQVFQIIANLLTNGLDALAERDIQKLTLSARIVDLPASTHSACLTGQCAALPNRSICVELGDSGSGMDEETLERIFDPYFSTKGVSRGLGLSGVLGLAKRLGIGLTCTSELGVGTVFRLYFAPSDAPGDTLEDGGANQPEATARPGKTVLVVDDMESVNAFISKLFSHWGWTVITAYSGEDALKQVQAERQIDLAIVDMMMSGMSGLETIHELRRVLPQLPAVIVSGYSEESIFSTLPLDEKTKFLIKPFGSELMKSVLNEMNIVVT